MTRVVVCGAFDGLRAPDLRLLEEAAKLGEVTVLLADDASCRYPFEERAYVLGSVRFVSEVRRYDGRADIPGADIWADREADAERKAEATRRGLRYEIVSPERLAGYPEQAPMPTAARKTAAVTGCFDWLHSGHVRFFEEASAFGDLHVFLGNDACIAGLKGEGHPLFPEDERRYMVGSIRYVARAQVSRGSGWLDADAELRALKPDYLIVNEDGDKELKRAFCREVGIEYVVLKRAPAPGLPPRSSTELRGY